MVEQVTVDDATEVVSTTEIIPFKKRLVELRLLGNNLKACHNILKREGYKYSYDMVAKAWGNVDVDPIIDELLQRQFADIVAIAEITTKNTIGEEIVTIDHKLKAYKLILQYRDKLLNKFMSSGSHGSQTQVNVIVPAPDPIPTISTS